VPFSEALFRGLAPDGGLYVPTETPRISPATMLGGSSFPETALPMARALLGESVSERLLADVIDEALDFPVPLVPLGDGLFVLELFHGPTLAFKDVGARFMAALMERLDPEPDRKRVVLVATSGDTGSAVAHAFAGRDRFQVIVLFPAGGVSDVQRRLFTTLHGNVVAAAVQGDFDDCQRLAKEAFRAPDAEKFRLTSANSINSVTKKLRSGCPNRSPSSRCCVAVNKASASDCSPALWTAFGDRRTMAASVPIVGILVPVLGIVNRLQAARRSFPVTAC